MVNKISIKFKEFLSFIKYKFSKSSVYQKFFLFFTVLVLITITVFTFTSGNWDFNSDTATANLLAEAMVREGTLFPKNWMYGQDLWVFFLHLPIALFTLFSDNYLMMHSVSAIIFIAMAVAVCIYFSRKVLKNNTWILAVPLLFCGVSYEYSYMVFGQCAYLPQIIYIFLTLALFTESFDEQFRIKSKLKFALLLLFIVFMGLTGIRNVQSVGLPLLGAIVLVYFTENHSQKLTEIIKPIISVALKIAAIAVSVVLGYVFFRLILKNLTYSEGIIAGLSIAGLEDIADRIGKLISDLLLVFNVTPGAELFSADGILSIIGLVAFVFFGIIFPILQFRKYNQESFGVKVFLMFSAVHTAEIIVIYLFTTLLTAARYVLTVQFLMFFISAHYIYKYILPKIELLSTLVTALLVVAFIFPQTAIHLLNITRHDEVMAEQTDIIDFLESQGLTYGFATYWNAGRYTVLSDGKVEINGILLQDYVRCYHWLNDSSRYSEEVHSGTSFIMLDRSETDAFKATFSYDLFGEPVNILEHGNYVIYVYDYNVSVNNFQGNSTQTG